jgi:benzodiazapine receptor
MRTDRDMTGELASPVVVASDQARQVVNVLTYGAVLWVNGLAGSGALSGDSIGAIANRYQSYFLPADYVFGIWALIYSWLLVFTVYQALPPNRGIALVRRLGWWWAISGLFNIAWIVTFSFGMFGLALIVMVGLLCTLVNIQKRVGLDETLTWIERVSVSYPFALYLSWISIALIANTFQFVTYMEWSGLGIDGPSWSATMAVVATGLGILVVWKWGLWISPLVVTWALVGIAVRFPEQAVITRTAWAMIVLGLVSLPFALRLGWERRRVHTDAR